MTTAELVAEVLRLNLELKDIRPPLEELARRCVELEQLQALSADFDAVSSGNAIRRISDLMDESTTLRQELAAVRAERDEKQGEVLSNQALQAALTEACDLAEEGWSYASPYFQEKWEYETRLEDLRELTKVKP